MKHLLICILLTYFSFITTAQTENGAKNILDQVSVKNASYKSIKTSFKYTIFSAQTQQEIQSASGTFVTKGNKYHLQYATNDIISDGKDVFTYLKASNEINITKAESGKQSQGDFFLSNPQQIFKAYKDYKSRLLKETDIAGITCYEIDLYPINLKGSPYSHIRMHIDKVHLHIVDIKLFQKDGTQITIELTTFEPNLEIAANEFIFDKTKYPKAQINDMRF